MPESACHTNLVGSLVTWIATSYFAGDAGGILVDSPAAKDRPPKIGGFVPDAFAEAAPRKLMIVGEAKTWRDLESRHTRDQLGAFLRWCQFNGGGVLVLAVPWPITRLAAALVRSLQQRHGCELVRTVVLDKLSG
jgi:hypothetical protein